MKAELVFTGTELLLGQIVNTNAQYLSKELAAIGIDVYYHVTVGDNLARLVSTIRQAQGRSDLVIVGGGLGPTEDDLSREALAEALGVPLEEDPEVMAVLRQFFERRGYPMPENNRKQALVPREGMILPNPIGTAPGLLLEHEGKTFVLLPGPPREFRLMVSEQLLPYLVKVNRGQDAVIRSRVLKIIGVGESMLEERVKDLLGSANPTLAPTAKPGEVHLRITAKAPGVPEADALIAELESKLRERLARNIYGVDQETLEGVVGGLLVKKGLTLGAAESCTGGLLAHRLTNIPGSSAYFKLGVVAYDNRWKVNILRVDEELLSRFGAVSPEVASAMATGIRLIAGTDLGVGITGIAGPGGATPEKPVGLVYLALDFQGKVKIRRELFMGQRVEVKERSAQSALTLLWRFLSGDLE
ncbi:damage-inducible protein CinA [Clostridiales bacterium PH28_bin88]|nr:damage-inducible protein CinA [Clostridiales bacterium PH28_bin88]